MRNRKNDTGTGKNRRTKGAHAAPPKASARSAAARKRLPAREAEAESPELSVLVPEELPQEPVEQKPAKGAKKAEREEKRQAKKEAARAARHSALKKLKIAGILLLIFVLLLAGGALYGGYRVTVSQTNLPKVSIDGVFVGGMTQAETLSALEAQGWDERSSADLSVSLPCDVVFSVDRIESGAMPTREEAAAEAYAYGHGGSLLQNLLLYLRNLLIPVDVGQEEMHLNGDYIRRQAQAGVSDFMTKTAGGGYEIDEKNERLVLVKGAGEMQIDLDALCQAVEQALRDDQDSLVYDRIANTLTMPDFDAIHAELGVEPADAHFIDGTLEVADEVVGCTFDVAQAQSLWQAAGLGQELHIPLQITYPEVSAQALRDLLFRDQLGYQTTSYSGSDKNRINNIHLAAEKLNGLVLMPGDEFSYNDTVGQRTTENGFLYADAYANGEVVKEVGGGICQVSSTLYCATMFAQMETVERTNHYFKVAYLGYALDATVSWGGPDFRFRNCRDYPVKIVTSCNDEDRTLTIEIWGTDVDGSYVELRSSTGTIYDEEYTDVVVAHGSQCTRSVYDKDGNLIEQIKEPYGVYHLHDYDIKWPKDKDKGDDGPYTGGDDSFPAADDDDFPAIGGDVDDPYAD